MNLAGKLKQLRQQRDISLRKLGEKAGVSYSIMNSIENGRYLPSPEVIHSIANALRYEQVDELLQLAEAHNHTNHVTNEKENEPDES